MARATKVSAATSLQAAVDFCSVAFKPNGPVNQTHIMLANKWAVAFDTVTAAGCPIEDDLTVYTHADMLQSALKRPGKGLSLTLAADGSRLSVKLSGFRANVPCSPIADVAPIYPDPPIAGVGEALREAFGAVAHIAATNGATVLESSLLVEANTVTATDRITMLQAWHGLGLPIGPLVIPRSFALAVLKTAKPLVSMGCGEQTFTLYFDDGSWLRTQLYSEPWPNIESVWPVNPIYVPLPSLIFNAVEAVAPFGGPVVYICKNTVAITEDNNDAIASQTVADLHVDPVVRLPIRGLKHIANQVTYVDWTTDERAVHFVGNNLRAVIMKMTS